jgi:hypothetical protein
LRWTTHRRHARPTAARETAFTLTPAAILCGEEVLIIVGVIGVLTALDGRLSEGVDDGVEREQHAAAVASYLDNAVCGLRAAAAERLHLTAAHLHKHKNTF